MPSKKSKKRTKSSPKKEKKQSPPEAEPTEKKMELIPQQSGTNEVPGNEKGKKKEVTKVKAGNRYTPISQIGYRCMLKSSVPDDMHIVSIDVYAAICQLWEQHLARSVSSGASKVINSLLSFKCALIAIMDNIAQGVRFSDIPTDVVICYPKYPVLVRKSDLEIIHSCSVPKGRVFIDRGNSCMALIAAITKLIPESIQSADITSVVNGITSVFNTKEIYKYRIQPALTVDIQLAEEISAVPGVRCVESAEFGLKLGATKLMLAAALRDDTDFIVYNPVVCELTEVAYLHNSGDDVQLISFQPISSQDVQDRLLLQSYSVRFFIYFRRAYKDAKVLVDRDKLDQLLVGSHRLEVLSKYGMMTIHPKQVVSQGDGADASEESLLVVEENQMIPKSVGQERLTAIAWNARGRGINIRNLLIQQGFVLTVSELRQLTSVRFVAFEESGIVWMSATGTVAYVAALVKDVPAGTTTNRLLCTQASFGYAWSAVQEVGTTEAWQQVVDDLPPLLDWK